MKTVTQGSPDPLLVSARFQRGTGVAGRYFGQTLRAYSSGAATAAWEVLSQELRGCASFSRTPAACPAATVTPKAATWNMAELSLRTFGERSTAFRLWTNECNEDALIHFILIQRGDVIEEVFYLTNNLNMLVDEVATFADLSDHKLSAALGLPTR